MRLVFSRLIVLAFFVGSLLSAVNVWAQVDQSAWLANDRPNTLAQQAVWQLLAANEDGLNPEHYRAAELAQTHDQLNALSAPDPILALAFSQRLSAAMTQYLNDLALGRVSASDVHQRFDGAPPRAYDAAAQLQRIKTQGDLDTIVEQARPNFPLYDALRQVLLRYMAMADHQAWQTNLPMPAGRKLEQGQSYPALDVLQARLQALGDLPESYVPSGVYDPSLLDAVKAFQLRHGLTVDGIVGPQTIGALNVSPAQRVQQIAISMERLRWTPLQQGERVIAVNIPGFMLYAYEIDEQGVVSLALQMRVVVGQVNRRTPIFDEDLRFIEFSPYWNIPYSIARRDTIPALRADPDYLHQKKLEFVDSSGQISTTVNAQVLQAVLDGDKRIRQRPGPHNALGGIKFILPNHQNIFLHHTPDTHLFECEQRARSSGCVRVEEPLALAMFVLADDPQWTQERIWQAMHAEQSQTIRLQNPIPVVLGYSTVMPQDDTVYFYPDVYGHDVTLIKALDQYRGLQ